MVVIVSPDAMDAVKASFESSGERVYQIGRIDSRGGEDSPIRLLNADSAWG